MKQTNNAIKFLVAHYRAIYKNAFIKGIASSILLTASFGIASSANAQETATPTLEQISPAYSVALNQITPRATGSEGSSGSEETETIDINGTQNITKHGKDLSLNININAESTGNISLEDDQSTTAQENLLHVARGTIDIKGQNGKATSGKLAINQGDVEFVDSTIVKSSGAQGESGGVIYIKNNTKDQSASLTLGTTQLSNFLLAKDKDGKALEGAVQGGIVVNGENATLKINSLDPLNLNTFTQDGSIKITNGTKAQAGTIAIDNEGTLFSDKIIIEQTLSKGNDLQYVSIKANSLTLGSKDLESAKTTTNIGFQEATVVDKLNFVDKSGTYTLKDDVILERNFYNKTSSGLNDTTNSAGQITGNVNITDSSTLSVYKGAWETNNNITLNHGLLVVTSSASTESSNAKPGEGALLNNADPSSLTIKGTLDIKGSTPSKVNVVGTKGANASLDLTQGTLQFTDAGTINLSGDPANLETDYVSGSNVNSSGAFDNKLGFGRLFINSKDFKALLDDKSKGIIEVESGGLLSVSDPNQKLTLDLDTTDVTVDNASSKPGQISFKHREGGVLIIGGDVNLTAHNANQQFNIEDNIFSVNSLNYKVFKDDSKDQTLADQAVIEQGKIRLVTGLTTDNDTFVLGDAATGSAATLSLFGNGEIKVGANDKHDFVIAGNDSQLNFEAGNWKSNAVFKIDAGATVGADPNDAHKSFITVGSKYNASNVTITDYDASQVSNQNVLNVKNSANATFDKVTFGNNNVFVDDATLTLNGTKDVGTNAGINLTGSKITVEGAEAKVIYGQNVADTIKVTDSGVTIDATLKNAITLKNNSEFTISFSDKVTFNNQTLNSLKTALGGDLSGGFINVGQAKLQIKGLESGEVLYNDFEGFNGSNSNVTSEQLKKTTIIGVLDESNFSNSIGAIRSDKSEDAKFENFNVNFTTNSTLNNAAGNNGYFISNSTKDQAGDAVVKKDNNLVLNGGGKIGSITLEGSATAPDNKTKQYNTALNINGNANTVTIIEGDLTGKQESLVNINSTTQINGKVDVDKIQVYANTTAKGSFAVNKMTVANSKFEMTIAEGSDPSTSVLTLKGGEDHHFRVSENGEVEVYNIDDTATDTKLIVDGGKLTVKDTLKGGLDINTGMASVKNLNATKDISVGQLAVDSSYADPEDNAAGSGLLEVTNSLTLGGKVFRTEAPATLPSVVTTNGFSNMNDDPTLNKYTAGELDGNLYVGDNAQFGVGIAQQAFLDKIKELQTIKSIANDSSIVYINQPFAVKAGSGFGVIGNGAYNAHKHNAKTEYTDFKDTAYLTQDSVIAVNVDNIGSTYNPNGLAAVTFQGSSAKVVSETGGYILLDGNVFANTEYNIFDQESGGTGVTINHADGTAPDGWEGIEVRTANGLLHGVVKNGSSNKVAIELNANYQSILGVASTPVIDTIAKYVTQDSNLATSGRQPLDPNNPNKQYVNNFLTKAAQGNGSAAETVARLGVYGGVVQSAQATSAATTDAISSRMGVGSNATTSISFAESDNGMAMWISAVHKTLDSSNFDAQGVTYGAEVEASGIALGSDFSTGNGTTVGVMINFGNGSSDGKNVADDITNDFDYYSFGAYAGYRFGKIDFLGDVSFTQTSNEIKAPTYVESVGTDVDSSLISAGITAQYSIDYKNYSLKPHAGIRYNMLKVDDYTIKGREQIASYDADAMNYFSLPVGVILSSDYVSGAWTFQPSIDLTVAYNFGDDTSDGTVNWVGIPLNTKVQSEVLDNLNYGINAGIMGSSKNKTFGLGIGYTGSSNTSSIGIKANFKYDF